MKYLKYCFVSSSLLLLALILSSCTTNTQEQKANLPPESARPAETTKTINSPSVPASLPVHYQTASYVVDKDESQNLSIAEESKLKVGARITSTRGPQPLWDILKRLASLKGMNVSWASDVDKNVLVDVDINANDDFYDALDSMLRQVDYYHEMQGSTIVVRYKETRQFHVAMPFIKQAYKTKTGGDVLGGSGGSESTANVAGEISLSTDGAAINKTKDGSPGGVEFNTWNSIENNLNSILNIWTTEEVKSADIAKPVQTISNAQADTTLKNQEATATFRRSSGANTYYIDKPVGLITVTAPRPLIDKIDAYFKSLKIELYKQISIEAKIIEVQLDDSSSLGINWSSVLKNFPVNATMAFGANGQVWPGTGQFVSNITLDTSSFTIFLNALNEQGNTKILSNPKLSVLNGQPALITVGRNVTYIDKVTSDVSSGTNPTITYTVDTARALSGVGLSLTANILDNNEIILNLVPVTSELVEPIEYRAFGDGEVGLPIINVREMSTTVRVKNGDMLVIGGLISDTTDDTDAFAPGLGEIPILKYFFGYKEKVHTKRELIILLKPRII